VLQIIPKVFHFVPSVFYVGIGGDFLCALQFSNLTLSVLLYYKRDIYRITSCVPVSRPRPRFTPQTNGLENFWALFKRCIKGTHVNVEPFHLAAYVDSEAFRFNNRETTDGGRFIAALPGTVGKRLTYKTLIGQDESEGAQGNGNAGANARDNFPMA
jgi:hypothetical protein